MQTRANKCQPPRPPMLMCCVQVGSNSSIWRAGLGCSERGVGQRGGGTVCASMLTGLGATMLCCLCSCCPNNQQQRPQPGGRVYGRVAHPSAGMVLGCMVLHSALGRAARFGMLCGLPHASRRAAGVCVLRAASGLVCVAQHHFSAKHNCSRVCLGAHVVPVPVPSSQTRQRLDSVRRCGSWQG